MRELVTVAQVETLFRVLALAGPLIGLLAGMLPWNRQVPTVRRAATGLLVGCVGLANYGTWRLYLAITERLGMDTVRNLLVNLAVFALIGAVIGLGVRRCNGKSENSVANTQPLPREK